MGGPTIGRIIETRHSHVLVGTTTLALALGLAFSTPAPAIASDCGNSFVPGQTPLTDLGASLYQGEQGGLYPAGSNQVPVGHESLGGELAEDIVPLDATGKPAPEGSIVLISIGVSNTKTEFDAFMSALAGDPDVNPSLVTVNGAIGGAPITSWLTPTAKAWDVVDRQLDGAGMTAAQVQAAWVMLPEKDPTEPFPVDADTYRDDLSQVLRNLKIRLPNVRLVYLSSRIYGGYGRQLSPEPWAYQHGFGVKWTIQDQIEGIAGLNPDPTQGTVMAPWIGWGAYLWANGLGADKVEGGEPGRSDGLEWVCSDFLSDGIHPSATGAAKVASMLMEHFVSDPTSCSWFLAEQAKEEAGCLGVADPEGAMHVAGVSVDFRNLTSTGRASVQVVDELGDPIGAVTVTGDWFRNGTIFDTDDSAVTRDDGRATITSGPLTTTERTVISFCVTDLDHSSFVYEPSQDTQQCALVRAS